MLLLSFFLTVCAIGITVSKGTVCHLVSLTYHGRLVWALESEISSECTKITIGGHSSLENLPANSLLFEKPNRLLTSGEDVQNVLKTMRKHAIISSKFLNVLTNDEGPFEGPYMNLAPRTPSINGIANSSLHVSTDTGSQLAASQPSTHSSNFKGDTTRSVTDHGYTTGSTGSLGNNDTISQNFSSQLFTSSNSRGEGTTTDGTDAVSEATTAVSTCPLQYNPDSTGARPQCPLLLEYKTNTIYQYRYLEIPVGSRCIVFEVRASNDVHIALSPSNSNSYSSLLYEIVIGGWGNTKSVMRRCGQCSVQTSVTTNQYLSGNEFRRFWVTFGSGGTIAVGKDIETIPFMEWTDPVPLDVHYLGYSTGYGSSGEFRFCSDG